MATQYVEYDSNNSGGKWWLTDEDWKALEAAGWIIEWVWLEHVYTDNGDYARDERGVPKLASSGYGNGKLSHLTRKAEGERWLGTLARGAFKPDATSLRDAVDEWERITGKSSTDAGCPCCGQPHHFTLYRDGKCVDSGPHAYYEASW